jgi:MraZ protein
MLLGTYKHSIDDKGRISVPSKFRSDLGERFVVCNGLDGCIFLISKPEWERLDQSIRSLSFKESRQLTRYFYAGATEVEIDAQGRICIPPVLREAANLKGASIIIGASNRVEIWNVKNWQSVSASVEQDDIIDLLDKINF